MNIIYLTIKIHNRRMMQDKDNLVKTNVNSIHLLVIGEEWDIRI